LSVSFRITNRDICPKGILPLIAKRTTLLTLREYFNLSLSNLRKRAYEINFEKACLIFLPYWLFNLCIHECCALIGQTKVHKETLLSVFSSPTMVQ
jgi:hypothetical protein